MRLLVTILSRQTVVQASLIREAAPDVIIFVSTVMAQENDWHKNIPVLVKRSQGEDIKYVNVFIEKNMNLGEIIEMLKRHVRNIFDEYKINEIYCDASCGKGIHRIVFAEYLKRFSEKQDLDFFLVYFDLDTRQINKIAIKEQSFREYKSSVSIDWHLKERLTLYGAELTDFLAIYDGKTNYFAENSEQFEELYTNLCNSMNLRAFFSSYDNMKTIIDLKGELHDFMVKNFRDEQIDKFLQRIFGVMPHLRPEINAAKNEIRVKLTDFFNEMSHRKELQTFSDSFDFRTTLASCQKKFNAEMPDAVIRKILPLAGEIERLEEREDRHRHGVPVIGVGEYNGIARVDALRHGGELGSCVVVKILLRFLHARLVLPGVGLFHGDLEDVRVDELPYLFNCRFGNADLQILLRNADVVFVPAGEECDECLCHGDNTAFLGSIAGDNYSLFYLFLSEKTIVSAKKRTVPDGNGPKFVF